MGITISVVLMAAFTPNVTSDAIPEHTFKRPVQSFERVATYDVPGQVAEIIASTPDGETLIYIDSATQEIGFVTITDPRHPTSAGSLKMLGEPTSVAVTPDGAWALVAVHGSSQDTLVIVDLPTRTIITTDQLTAAGHTSFSPILQKTSPLETFTVGGVTYIILVAALDTTDLSDPDFGRSTNAFIGQDSGDVLALLSSGYNFDGTQNPVVIRQGDPASTMPILSVPNFYGAHGYDPLLSSMIAIFYAAGPGVGRGILPRVRNVDIAPTIANILGVPPALTVHGRAIDLTPRRQLHFP
jgi:hypothetical protein